MLDAAPMQQMIVRSDGRVEMSPRLADWLGLAAPARFLADLDGNGEAAGGLPAADFEGFSSDIQLVRKAGAPMNRSIRPKGGMRTIALHCHRAPVEANVPGGVIVWALDVTDATNQINDAARIAQQAQASFAALAGLIEVAPMPMWYRDADLRLGIVNSAYVSAVEARDAADVIARGVELVEGAGQGGPLAGALAAKQKGGVEARAIPATIRGERRMLRVFDVALPDGGVAGFAVDITDLDAARADLKRFADARRAMLDRLSAGVVQFAADRSLVFANLPFQRLFGLSPDWLGDRPEFDRVLEKMRETGRLPEVRDFPGWKAERREWFLAAEGAIEEQWHIAGPMHLRVVAHPLPDGGLLIIFEDRTEQIQLSSARDTLLRVRTATFDNLFEALGVFSADGRLQIWNNRFRGLWQFEEELLAAHPRVDALAAAVGPRLADPRRKSLIVDLVRAATVERQQRGGELALTDGRFFALGAVPLPDGNGLLTMIDVTDSRRIERALRDRNEALEAADHVKSSFVANMSYELRTPITSISGFAEMMQAGYAGALPGAAAGYVDAIIEAAAKLGALVDNVLDLTQQDGDATLIQREDMAIVPVAERTAEALMPLIRRKRIAFVKDFGSDTGSIKGDPRRVGQIIEHLLRHAIAATPEGGRILLHTSGDEANVRIIVSDNGVGMTAEGVARAFDRFTANARTSNAAANSLAGIGGVGLPLARQLAQAHGGSISLVSEPGEGSVMTVDLPR